MFEFLSSFKKEQTDSVINLNPEEFAELLSSSADKSILVDVRTKAEFDSGHLKNAKLIDISSFDFLEKVKALDKSKNILLYCRSGNRSKVAGKMMKQLGFSHVYHLKNGILSWKGEIIDSKN